MPSERRARRGLPQDSRTASAAQAAIDGAELGQFDLQQLRNYRDMAERHVRSALSSLRAAADPTELIAELFLDEFADAAVLTWANGRGLVTSLFGELPNPIYQSVVTAAIKESRSHYQELLRTLIGQKAYGLKAPIFGEFITGEPGHNTRALVQSGDVRPLLVTLGGGTTDATVPLMGGITSGHTMREWLRSNGIDTDKKIWLYGYETEPRRTFNGHLQMDGLVFEDWNDDGLKIAPQDAWLRRSHYAPGDHWGCACIVAPFIPNYDEAYTLETPAV